MRVSETGRKRASVKAAVASAAVVEHHDDPRCARRGISQGTRLTALGMQQNSTSSIACLETTLTYIVKVAVVFLARHRGPVGDDDNLHVLGLADDSLYRISGQ